MKVSKQNRRSAKELFRSCLGAGTLDDQRVRDTVAKVLEARPRGYLGILNHFERLLRLELARRSARVESAVPLTPDLQARIRSGLANQYGPNLNITFLENPGLLAGLRIQIGSDVYDGSVQARLEALNQSFST